MSTPQHRLNPFVLPSETRVRFTLLIVAAITLTLNLGFFLADFIGLPALYEIPAQIKPFPAPGTISQPGGAAVYREHVKYNIQFLCEFMRIMLFPVILVLGTFGIATLLYRAHPWRIRHRQNLKSLTDFPDKERAEELQKAIDLLASQAKVSLSPKVEIPKWRLFRRSGFWFS